MLKHHLRNLYGLPGPLRATVRDVDFHRHRADRVRGVEHVVTPNDADTNNPIGVSADQVVVVDFCPIAKWNAMSTTARHHWFIAGRRR